MSRRFLAFLLAALAPISAHADTTGRATVIDGDTIEIRGERVRLDAIDAPESGQTCEMDGKPWHCGQQAALAQADLIGNQITAGFPLECSLWYRCREPQWVIWQSRLTMRRSGGKSLSPKSQHVARQAESW